jgi:hypothetical protein
MLVTIEPKKIKYEPYLEDGCTLKSGIIDFRIFFTNLKNEDEFSRVRYALTEAIANTINDFEKAFTLGSRP